MLAPLFTRARIALLVVVGDVVGLISLVGGCVVVCAVASEAGAVGGVAGVDERQSADGAGAVSLIPGALAFRQHVEGSATLQGGLVARVG